MNKKGVLPLDKWVLAFVILALFVIIGTMLISDINDNYETVDMSTADFNESYQSISEMYNLSQEGKRPMIGNETEIESTDEAADSMVKGSYKTVVTIIPNTFGLFGNILTDVLNVLNVANAQVITTIVLAGITFMILFALIAIFMKVVFR